MNLPTLFRWNRIVGAVNHSDRITFTLTEVAQESMVSAQYVIDRFKSFGRKDLNEFALKLEQLMHNNQYSEVEAGHFPRVQDLIPQRMSPNWVSIHGDYSNGFPHFSIMEISHSFCRRFGMTPEQMMGLCVKYGELPIK